MTAERSLDPTSLAGRIADLDEQGALDVVAVRATRGEDPFTIIQECQIGMQWVGEHYQSGKYYISGLIMAGEIFREAMEILRPLMPESGTGKTPGSIVLCTVQGDIHDLGKNIVDMMLRSYGFVVHDLGVDVAPQEVAARALELRPDIVGLSGLLTVAAEGMRSAVNELRAVVPDLGRPLPVIIGGGVVDEQMRRWTGADLWADDAARGVQLIRDTVASGQR
jgi:methylmalonyl-CoA mutase cobalamin-binding domain/chain